MYRGNVPGQFNGNQIQSGQEYSNPGHSYGVRIPQPNQMSVQQSQPSMHGRVIQGQQGGHNMSEMQHFPDSSFIHSTPASHSQMQFGNTQQYSADRYAYNQGKMVRAGLSSHSQSYSGMSTPNMPPNHVYNMQNHGRSVGYGGNTVPDLPVVSETSLSMQQFRNSKNMPAMWSGSKQSEAAPHHQQYGQSGDTAGNLKLLYNIITRFY